MLIGLFSRLLESFHVTNDKSIYPFSQNFQIQTLPHFAFDLSTKFHDFYNSCKVLSEDTELTKARIALIQGTKYVLANTLEICGIEAPEKM